MFPNRSKIYKPESSAKHKDKGLKTITISQPSRTLSTSRSRPRPPYDGSWADMLRFDLKPKFKRGVVDTILEKLRKEMRSLHVDYKKIGYTNYAPFSIIIEYVKTNPKRNKELILSSIMPMNDQEFELWLRGEPSPSKGMTIVAPFGMCRRGEWQSLHKLQINILGGSFLLDSEKHLSEVYVKNTLIHPVKFL